MAVERFEHTVGRRMTIAFVCGGIGLSLVAGVWVVSLSTFVARNLGARSGSEASEAVGLRIDMRRGTAHEFGD